MVDGESSEDIRIKAFMCTWSHFMNEDVGSHQKYDYSPEVSVQRIVCSGSLDMEQVMDAFIEGADGVFLGTCEPEACRFTGKLKYNVGSKQASAKIHSLREALKVIGLEPERLRVEWLSPKKASRFDNFIEEFQASLSNMGRIPREKTMLDRMKVMKEVLAHFRMRWIFGKKLEITTHGNAFGELVDGTKLREVMGEMINSEYVRMWILNILSIGPATIKDISDVIDVETDIILMHMMRLRQRGNVSFCGERGDAPIYCKEGAP